MNRKPECRLHIAPQSGTVPEFGDQLNLPVIEFSLPSFAFDFFDGQTSLRPIKFSLPL